MAARPYPGSERPLHGALRRFDLKAEVERLGREKERQEVGATPSRYTRSEA